MQTATWNFFIILFILPSAALAQLGTVRGSVFDPQDAVIPGAVVTIQNPSRRKTVMSDENGQFSFNLPPGIYSISTDQRHWWWAVRRSNFRVTADETVVVNINPTHRVLSVALVATDSAIKDVPQYNYTPQYDVFAPVPGAPLNLVVEYRKRDRKGRTFTYTDAKLTYDALTIIADVLRFDQRLFETEAIGNVTVDKRGVREKGPSFKIKIEPVQD